jgi:hypothetical protein
VENENAPASARTFDDKHPELAPAPNESAERLLERACHLLGRHPAELTGPSRSRSISMARRRFTLIAVAHFGHRGTVVARTLRKSPCQVSRWLSVETETCSKDQVEAHLIEEAVVALLS